MLRIRRLELPDRRRRRRCRSVPACVLEVRSYVVCRAGGGGMSPARRRQLRAQPRSACRLHARMDEFREAMRRPTAERSCRLLLAGDGIDLSLILCVSGRIVRLKRDEVQTADCATGRRKAFPQPPLREIGAAVGLAVEHVRLPRSSRVPRAQRVLGSCRTGRTAHAGERHVTPS